MHDRTVVAVAVVVAMAARVGPPVPAPLSVLALIVSLAVAVVLRWPVVFGLALALVAGGRSHAATVALAVPPPERISGVAELVSDPERGDFGTRVMVRVDGRRWLAEVPRDLESSIGRRLMGDRVRLVGRPRPLTGAPRGWVLSRHLAGRLTVQSIGGASPTTWWYAVANEVHRRLDLGSRSFDEERRPLFLGLVLGDDRDQSDLMSFRFRASGLGHLLAVSGQNVAFLMAVAAPLLSRIRIRWRWIVVAALLALFVLTTRAEPSVLRAAAMSGTAAVATSMGRIASGTRVIALAVIGLLVADPLLVHSTGFQLSVAASASLLVLARPIGRRLPGPGVAPRTPLDHAGGTDRHGPPPARPLCCVATSIDSGQPPRCSGRRHRDDAGPDDRSGRRLHPGRPRCGGPGAVAWAGVVDRRRRHVVGPAPTPSARSDADRHPGGHRSRNVAAPPLVASTTRRPDRGLGRVATAAAIVGAATAVVVGTATMAPPSWAIGRHVLGSGVALVVDRCGGRTIEVENRIRVADALDGVWLAGLFRADRVVSSGRKAAAVEPLADHLGAEPSMSGDLFDTDPTRCPRPP